MISSQQDSGMAWRARRQLCKGGDEPHEGGVTLAGLFGNSIGGSAGNNKDMIAIERGDQFLIQRNVMLRGCESRTPSSAFGALGNTSSPVL